MSITNSGQNFSPYSTTTQTAAPSLGMDVSTQIKKYKTEEQLHKAPKELPFTLSISMDQISQAYTTMLALRNSLEKTAREPKTNTKAIQNAQRIIDDILEKMIVELPLKLDKLFL